MSEIITQTASASTPATVNSRTWSTEQDGPNDKMVDIWHNNRWVPAFFKDILAGDFFMVIGVDLEPGRCFLAGSDAKACGHWNGKQTFIVQRGMEIVQAPALKDIPADALSHKTLLIKD